MTVRLAFADPNSGVISQRKIVGSNSSNELVRVLALPVTDFNVDYYYRVEEYDRRLTDADINRIRDLVVQEVNLSIAELLQGLTSAIQQASAPRPTPTPIHPHEDDHGEGDHNHDDHDDYDHETVPAPGPDVSANELQVPQAVHDVFQINCISCHTEDQSSKYDFENYTKWNGSAWVSMQSTDAWDVADTIDRGYMPKNATELDNETNVLIRNWARTVNRVNPARNR